MKILQTILIIICTWSVASASHAEPALAIAFKGGPNAATLAENNRSNRYGFSGGFAGNSRWPLIGSLSLAGQIEVLYTPRGAEAIFNGELLAKSREHYFDVMVAARPEVQLGRASIYFLLGGGVSFLVSASKENAAGAGQDITGDLHRIDVALLGGVGVALELPHRQLGPFHLGTVFLEARHDIGLLDTDAINGGYKNRTSSLMLGLSFAIADS